jgi:dihydroorotate dehydrogenase
VSSPNTPGLRDLQARDSLAALMDAVMTARNTTANISGKRVPVLLKIAPDLDEMALDDIASVLSEKSVDGLIVSNTTLARDGLASRRHVEEAGGLSGRPVFERSTIVLAKMRQRVGPALPIVGVGGVDTPEAALTKISAGADLVQLYTGFIYHGPLLARQVADGLLSAMERDGVEHISAYRDRAMEEWAARSLPRPSA